MLAFQISEMKVKAEENESNSKADAAQDEANLPEHLGDNFRFRKLKILLIRQVLKVISNVRASSHCFRENKILILFTLKKAGQNHDAQHPQWRHLMAKTRLPT